MKKAEIRTGSESCPHKWVKREKQYIEVLHRVCTECGKEELHSESPIVDDKLAKKIMRMED